MAFEYTPYRNPYIGTIADLMARGEDAKAKALIDVASAQARAAEAKGQIYGNAISSIGQDISKSLRDYNSPAAKQQREMDQAQAILKARGLETRQDERMRVNPGNLQPGRPFDVFTDAPVEGLADKAFSGIDFRGNPNPSVRADATFRMVDGEPIEVPAESFNGLPSAISRSNVFGGQPETTPSDGLSRSMAGVLGQTETRTSLPTGRKASLESYKTAPVGRYTTEQGMYDVKTAYNDLIQAGISPTVAGALAGQGQQANAIFAAFDKQKEDLAKTEVAMRGSIASMVLNTYKANPNMPLEDILPSVMGPAGNRIPAQDLEDFQVAMFGKSPQEQIQMLQSLVKQWDDQGAKQVVNPGDSVMFASGNLKQIGPTPVSPAAQELAQNMSDWRSSGSKLPYDQWLASGRRTPAADTSSIQEYNFAVKQGYTGSFEQWSIDVANRRLPSGADQSETIGLRNDLLRLQIDQGKVKAEDLQKTKDLSKRAAEETAQSTVDTVSNLVTIDPKTGNVTGLAPGTSNLFGARIPFLTSIPGLKTSTADAYLRQLTAERIVELIGEMKSQSRTGATGFGPLAVAELRVLQDASTVLSQRNISDAIALKELTKIYNIARKYNQSVAPAPNKSSGIITDPKDPNFGQPKPQ